MKQIETYIITQDDEGTRLDRILKRIMPEVPVTLFQKMLRKKDIKLNGGKAEGGAKVVKDDVVTYPESLLSLDNQKPEKVVKTVSKSDEKFLKSLILYEDKKIIVINKPFGLAVQGGSGISRHIDGLLDSLVNEEGKKPHLVHRLDRDTSGVMVLAKDVNSAAKLSKCFKERKIKKIYWAVVDGVPKIDSGRIDLNIDKTTDSLKEKMAPDEDGKKAVTYYNVISTAGTKAAWLELLPLTGRKHQIRVHLAAIGNPIIGDGKYGGKMDIPQQIDKKLHLHARAIKISGFAKKDIDVIAPMPEHLKKTFDVLGFYEEDAGKDPFLRLVK
ncbi:MAG: RluA family pseudouridine synthase [Alphaproteobacteria bacterium]